MTEPGWGEGIEVWPTDEDMMVVCGGDPRWHPAGCGHTLGQHAYGDDLAPCDVPGCPCRDFK